MTSNPDWQRLAAFRAVAREGGFSRAGERLHRTQPAVSQAVRALEEDLGEPLFHRLGRGVRLTRAGETLLAHVEQAFGALERGRAELDALRDLEAGELRIGTSDTNACYLLPPVLAAFRERHPGVELLLSNRPSPATEAQVVAREVDLGVVTLPADDPRLVAEPIARREDVAIFAPTHPLAARRRVRIAELARYPLLLLDRGSRSRAVIDAQLRAVAASTKGGAGAPRIAMELASIEVVKRLVALDFGVSVVPRIAVDAEVANGSLACATVFRRQAARSVGIVLPAGAPIPRAARVFVELARSLLGGASTRPSSSTARR